MTVTVDIPDFSNLVDLASERATKRITARVQEQAVATAPVDTGEYRRNIVADFNSDEVRAEAVYSRALEYGLPARTITPKNGKALRFKVGGKTVYAKKVNLPSRGPNPVMRNASRKVQREVQNIFNQELNKAKG